MAINEYKTRTGVELVAEGTLRGIYFNPLKEKKNYGRDGRDWFPTHSVNIIVDDDRISLGITDSETIRCKDEQENYHDLASGMEISVVVTENGEYNGKTQYQGRPASVIITKGVEKAASFSRKPNDGVQVGHAINCAIQMLGGDALDDNDTVIELAKKFHTLTSSLKEEYAGKNPDVSEYDIGARVGQGVLSATHIVGEFGDVEAVARNTIENLAPAIEAFVKEGKASPAAVKKTPEKKTAAKKAAKKATPAPENESPDDMDDDIPF